MYLQKIENRMRHFNHCTTNAPPISKKKFKRAESGLTFPSQKVHNTLFLFRCFRRFLKKKKKKITMSTLTTMREAILPGK